MLDANFQLLKSLQLEVHVFSVQLLSVLHAVLHLFVQPMQLVQLGLFLILEDLLAIVVWPLFQTVLTAFLLLIAKCVLQTSFWNQLKEVVINVLPDVLIVILSLDNASHALTPDSSQTKQEQLVLNVMLMDVIIVILQISVKNVQIP